jgi:tRNA threonylcarbamoyladenosine biosynthesis protein TsaE
MLTPKDLPGKGVITSSAEETAAFGALLGDLLKKRGGPLTVCLYGDLGAGKTTFIKGFAGAFGVPERDIGSASYVIVAEYETSPPFYHMDLYRLGGDPCSDDMGLWEYIESDAVVVIEWAERLGEMPDGAVSLRMNILGEDRREMIVSGLRAEEEESLTKAGNK